ncbi:MAG: IPTL-CTERM sorting domain-containing protein [Cocleimonas sp.]
MYKNSKNTCGYVTAAMLISIGLTPMISYSAPISGSVFRDLSLSGSVPSTLNISGVKEANEITFGTVPLGVAGITVNAVDAAGTTATAITSSDGSWTIPGLSGDIRVEFSNIPAFLKSSFNGTDSNSSVQFVSDGDTNIDFGVHNPASFFNNTNPELVGVTYKTGDPLLGDPTNLNDAASTDAIILFNDNDEGLYDTSTYHKLANMRNVGTTWGMAYQRSNDTIFVGASIRRHAGLGSLGTGGIYAIDKANSTTIPWLDINTLAGVNTGSNPRSGGADNTLPQTKAAPSVDLNAFSAVAKTAIGDMDISEDDKTLYVMDLGSRQLVAINTDTKALTGAPIAVPTAGLPTTAGTCQTNDVRPWAVKVHDGEVYVGAVCSAENSRDTDDLHAYLMKLDGNTLTVVFDYPLTFTRGDSGGGGVANWEPWARTWADVHSPTNWATHVFSPIFSDIEFDIDGAVIMGFMDRGGHQIGASTHQAIAGDTSTGLEGLAQGDILRACPDVPNVLGAWTLESNGSCGGVTTAGAGNNEGPGGGEFYQGDFGRGPGSHTESATGGIVLIPGSGRIATTLMDPLIFADGGFFDVARNHGINWLSNSDGSDDQGYVVVPSTGGVAASVGTFSKANAMGDLEALSSPAPLQIGNRVWEDSNNNGIQDPGEPGLNGVDVTLTFPGGLTTTTTTATVNGVDGVYLFNDGDLTGGVDIPRNTDGTISVSTSATLTDASAGSLTLQNQGATNTDSNPDPTTGTFSITTGSDGENDHTFDIGYSAVPPPIPSIDIEKATNGSDADTSALAVILNNGDPVTWSYVVTNNGAETVNNIVASDNLEGGITCPKTTLLINESMTCSDKSGTAAVGDYVNIASVSGVGAVSNSDVNDSDPSHYKVAPPSFVKIGNLVWIEDDNDGNSTTGNLTPVVGVLVTATASGGATYTGTTNASGNYLIDVPQNDTYTVTVATPSGVIPTFGSSDNSVPDTATENNKSHSGAGTTVVVGIIDNLTLDFGFTPPPTPLVQIGNLVWIEDDNDGDSTTGNITPVVGVLVTATASGGTIYTGTTDASGNYLIDVPQNDTYTVTVATPSGVIPTFGSSDNSVPDTTTENNKSHNGAGTTVDVGTEDNLTLDFGFTPPTDPLVQIGNLVWIEDDNDGDSTTGNITPVVGAVVTATASDGTIYTDTTDASGNYLIDVPQNDTYVVTVASPAAHLPTSGSDDNSVPDAFSENNKTHNGIDGTTVVVTTEDNLTLDFGFVPTVKIGSLIWYEDDNDGDATTGNVTYPPAGVLVTATAEDGKTYTSLTGENGSYSINVPINSTYVVTIAPPAGFSPTSGSDDTGVPSDDSENNLSHNGSGTTVTVGTIDNLTVDFGFINNATTNPPSNEPIPTLSEWALLMLMMMLGFIGYRQGLTRKR